jgi:hypothetical protein
MALGRADGSKEPQDALHALCLNNAPGVVQVLTPVPKNSEPDCIHYVKSLYRELLRICCHIVATERSSRTSRASLSHAANIFERHA